MSNVRASESHHANKPNSPDSSDKPIKPKDKKDEDLNDDDVKDFSDAMDNASRAIAMGLALQMSSTSDEVTVSADDLSQNLKVDTDKSVAIESLPTQHLSNQNVTLPKLDAVIKTGVDSAINTSELESFFNKISAKDLQQDKGIAFTLKNTPFTGSDFVIKMNNNNDITADIKFSAHVTPIATIEAIETMRTKLNNMFPDANINVNAQRVERQEGRQQGDDSQHGGKNQQQNDEDEIII